MLNFLGTGIIIGFTIGAVVGPIGILCISRSISSGMLAGLAVGLGAALADAVYGGIAAFGLTTLCDFLLSWSLILQILGGSYLIWLGISTFKKIPKDTLSAALSKTSYTNLVTSTFLLTITSPVTILAFLAIFASYDVTLCAADWRYAAILTFGVFLGSMVWWIFLSGTASFFGKKLSPKGLRRINQASGAAIALFGAYILLKAFKIIDFVHKLSI